LPEPTALTRGEAKDSEVKQINDRLWNAAVDARSYLQTTALAR
jgi:hypothetical protein